VPTTLLRMSLNSWRDGTEDIVPHDIVKEYIQTTSSKTGVEAITLYNTRVDSIAKQGHKWQVQTTTLSQDNSSNPTTSQSWVRSQIARPANPELMKDRSLTLSL